MGHGLPNNMNQSYTQGQAPWETNQQPQSFSAGNAPWEQQNAFGDNPQMGVLPKPDYLQKASDIVGSIFPGKQLGNAIGTNLNAGYQAIKTHSLQPIRDANQENENNMGKIIGDTAAIPLTALAPMIGGGTAPGVTGALGRVGANAALGAGLGLTGAVSQGQDIRSTAKNTAIGATLGGGLAGAGEIGSYLTKNLPNWFTKLALPKLSNSKINGAPEDVVNYALNNTKGATLRSMYNNSTEGLKSYENQVQAVLSHPQYAAETGSKTVLNDVAKKFDNAQLTPEAISKYAKNVAPAEKELVDKVANGTANLQEKNQLRKVLDQATKKRFIQGVNFDTPKMSFAKEVGGAFADILRKDVQSTAKETIPIFSDYSKEHALNKALGSALSKKRVAGPLVAGAGGYASGGLQGAAEAVAIEEGLRSPTAKLLAGKAIQGLSKVATPAAQVVLQGGKAPLINAVSRKSNQ